MSGFLPKIERPVLVTENYLKTECPGIRISAIHCIPIPQIIQLHQSINNHMLQSQFFFVKKLYLYFSVFVKKLKDNKNALQSIFINLSTLEM